ncbi:iron-sulfur cluster-binding protein [Luminiphilus syltensis NOR5-1B]|uniref:Iron-sulfur cluster-binding protein n=1 Tax=Luminiphilus syltensis NOR5-1B TaxID=565045 RepID=B8KVW0_9GAMM|nr:4Fe-4S dicluster domain-containing protein [Luminiphilus syltensis]EED34255.1 iron-sulfur cluster-binding protein [Luminiphilus syltensis NOR5-1B]
MPKNPYRPYTPNPEFLALLPEDYSGNAVNGVGEEAVRPPTMVWWAPDMESAEFGAAQQWFYEHEQPDEEMIALRAYRRDAVLSPLPPVAEVQQQHSESAWTAALDDFVQSGDCEMTGVTPLQPQWIFDHAATSLPNVVMLAFQHDYEELQHVPALRGGKDVTRQYGRAAVTAKKVASWIREQGWQAEPVTGPMTGTILLIPPAIECGFGELGKHGSIINPEFGSAFRLSAVLTDAPFAATSPREFGIDDFCSRCRVCENACPPAAITPEKKTVRGSEKWYVDFDKCIPFFAETSGCAICIAVCPWSLPGVGINLVEKLARRARRLKPD